MSSDTAYAPEAAGPGIGLEASRASRRALYALGALPFGALLFAGIGVVAGLRGAELNMHLIATVTLLLCFLPPAIDRTRSIMQRNVFLSIFGPIYAIYFVAGVYSEYFFMPESDPAYGPSRLVKLAPEEIVMGQLAALLALVALYVGFLLPIGSLGARLVPNPRTDWPLSSTLRIAVMMAALGWFLIFAGQFGLLPGFFGNGVLGSFASSFYFSASILMIAWLRFGASSAVAVMLALIPPAMVFSFFTGSKKLFLSPIAIVAMTHIMYTRRLRISWLAAGGALLILIYPVASFYRDAIQVGNQLSAFQVLQNPQRVINGISAYLSNAEASDYLFSGIRSTSARLSALGILTVIVRDTPQIVPYQDGWTIGYNFIAFVPRFLWPGKPSIGIGQWVTDNYGGGPMIRSLTGCTWAGELYFNYGWIGIALGMMLLGVGYRFLQDAFMRPNTALPVTLVGVVVLWVTLPGLQGSLQVPMTGILFSMFPIIFAHLMVRFFLGAVPWKPVPIGGIRAPEGESALDPDASEPGSERAW